MKVLYDHQAFQMQYFGGVSKCFCELIAHLPNEVEATISIKQSDNVHLWNSGLVKDLQHVTIDHKTWIKKYPGKLMDMVYLAANKFLPLPTADSLNRRCTYTALKNQDFDVFHPTYFKPEFLKYIGKKPFVVTIHDMMPELYPQYYGTGFSDVAWKKTVAEKASAIVAVSENTKKDAIRILGIPENKITVIYHGGPDINANLAAQKSLIDGRYFLYVGQRIFYKNFDKLLMALAAKKAELGDVKLVCTGSEFTAQEMSIISRLGLQENIVHVHPSDEEMAVLYRDALAFIYPSEYEGFGMPILEAYACGCPVLLNNASCFPEVAGDAAKYFNLTKGIEELSDLLSTVSHWTTAERQEMQAKGYARLKQYSWQKASEQLAEVYRSVVRKN